MPYLSSGAGSRPPAGLSNDEQVPVMPEQLAARVADAISAEWARRAAGGLHGQPLDS
jgi:hypothetical protein